MNYEVPVLSRHISAATQTDATTSLMLAIIDQVTGVPGATLAQQSALTSSVNIDGTIYNEDAVTVINQNLERVSGIKPLSPYVAQLSYATNPL